MKSIVRLFVCVFFLSSVVTQADILQLKNGELYEGEVVKETDSGIRFQVGDDMMFFSDEEIKLLKKSPSSAQPTPSAPQSNTSSAPPPPTSEVITGVHIPKGTILHVRLKDDITSKHKAGHKFTTELETNIVHNGRVLVNAGTTVYGEVAKSKQQRALGRSSLAIELTSINIGGQVHPITTNVMGGKGERKVRQAARTAAVGALAGGAIDGKSGAKTGAGVGAAVAMLGSETVGVKAGTILEFKLEEAAGW